MDTRKAIIELDKVVASKGLHYVLYTCGGTQLIFLGHDSRRTQDVDLIIEKIDNGLLQSARKVAKKLDLETDWLNNNVYPLGKRLGRAWKSKCIVLFEGKAIKLMGLARQDLINAKLHAAVDRMGEDYNDLIFLKPNLEEIKKAKRYVLNLKKDLETAHLFVNQWVKELKRDLGLN